MKLIMSISALIGGVWFFSKGNEKKVILKGVALSIVAYFVAHLWTEKSRLEEEKESNS